MRSRVFTAIAAAELAGGLAAAAPASAKPLQAGTGSGSPGTGTLIPAHKGEVLPLKGGTVDSLNWSGYAVTGSAITGVVGTFVVRCE